MEIETTYLPPATDEFIHLRNSTGWESPKPELVQKSFDNSLFHVTLRSQGSLLGMARVVGDGVMYFYIQDVVVDPDYQGLGLGHILMREVEDYLARTAKAGATIALLSVSGKEDFYQRYGYQARPTGALGHGMCKFV